MSAGGYDAPHIPSAFPRFEPRRSSGGIPSSYDRPPNATLRRRSPSLGLSRRPYDSYVPHRSEMPFHDGLPNVYRPNNYRPEYSGTYYSRSPSPDPYVHQSRISEPEVWDRGSSWRAPPPIEAPNVWPERKNIPPSPTTSSRGRGLREDSSRMFEPSASWKQTHVDRPSRTDYSPPSERYFDRRPRGSLDASPDRPVRNDRPPAFIPGGDRYRPASSKRDSFPLARSDSYRPQYDNSWNSPFRREPISPTSSHHRRDSGSVTHARTSDRYESPHSSRAVSRKASMSPRGTVISPMFSPSSPSWGTPNKDNETWSYPSHPAQLEPPTRVPSRSSIASTHVSDRKSPSAPLPPPPPPTSVVSQPVAQKDAAERPKSLDQKGTEKTADESKSEAKKIPNGTLAQPTLTSLPEPNSVPDHVPSVPKKPTTDVSIVSNDISVIKQSSSITNSPVLATIQTSEVITSKPVSFTSVIPQPNGAPVPSISPVPMSTVPSPPPPPIVTEVSSVKVKDVLEIKQPKPSYRSSPVGSLICTPEDINIPPPTHSPILTTPPPIDEEPVPAVFHKQLPIPEEIPPFSEAKSTADALRIVVMTRLLCDRQSREERIKPVLTANLSISNPPEAHPIATPDTLIEKMFSGTSLQERLDSFVNTRPSLSIYLKERHAKTEDKIAKLREEYIALQERWIAHCNSLNEQQKNLASEQENQHTGRTTRRSTAITDAVRSDFEMEQIIASLGVDDATDPNHLSMRNLAKIPDMISVTNGHIDYLFDDTSHLVENPSEYYAPHTGIHDWTDMEKQIFLDKFAAYPKQFGIIADYLPNKTAAQCVDYYYLHKKQFIDFRRVVSQFAPNKRRRRGMGKKKGNGLLVDIAKHDMEVHRGSGSASPSVVARAPRGRKTVIAPEVKKAASSVRRNAVQFEETPASTPTPEPESRTRRRKAAATMSTPTSAIALTVASSATYAVVPSSAPTSAPVSVVLTPSISSTPIIQRTPVPEEEPPVSWQEPEPEPRPVKRVKRTRKIKSAATVSDDHDPPSPGPEAEKELPVNGVNGVDGSESAARGKKDKVTAPSAANQWSEDDKNLFLSLLSQYGDDFKRIAASMPNKTTIQVSNFYKTHGAALNLDKVAAKAPKRSPTPEQREVWKELPLPGSGVITSVSTSKNAPVSSSTITAPVPPMSSLASDSGRSGHPNAAAFFGQRAAPPAAPAILRPSQSAGNPYPHAGSPPQPSMARSTNSKVHPPEGRRLSIYSPPARNASYPYPHTSEPQGVYHPNKPPDNTNSNGSRPPPGLSSPLGLTRPYLAPRPGPGYIPPPAVGPNAPSIVHSPTGMNSPKPLPMQPMQSYPAQQSDPSHRGPGSYYPYLHPPHPHVLSRPGTDPRTNLTNLGTSRFFNPDGTSPYASARRTSGSSDDRGNSASTNMRRDNSHPMFNPGSASGAASRPPGYSSLLSSPPASSSSSPSGNAPRPTYYYPGWTS